MITALLARDMRLQPAVQISVEERVPGRVIGATTREPRAVNEDEQSDAGKHDADKNATIF